MAFFMVGFPQETKDSLNDTLKAIKEIPAHRIFYSVFTPYPGTEAFEFCKEKGLINDDFDVSLYNHQSPENCFCMNLSLEEFRSMVNKIESVVDRKNTVMMIKFIFSKAGVQYIIQRGFLSSLKFGIKGVFR